MSGIEEKLLKLNLQHDTSISPLQQSVMSNFSIVSDDASDFIIENRNIQSYIPLIDVVVQNDINSRILSFKASRYFDNIDLSEKSIQVNYINAKKQSGSTPCVLETVNDNDFTFLWTVSGELTIEDGKIEYGIEFFEKNLDDRVIYSWNTKSSYFNVEKSLIILNDAIPTDYTKEKTFYDENNNLTEYLNIKDTDKVIQIDNRTILTGLLKDVVVAQDNVSQIVSFKINRYFDGTDLATKLISIKYINAAGRSDRTHAVNVKVLQLEIEFGWLIDSKFTEIDGIGFIAIEFLGYDEKGDFYVWQTKPIEFPIEQGLFIDDSIPEPEPSWIQSLNLSIVKLQTGKADLINGKVPSYQLPSGGGIDLTAIEDRITNLESNIEFKSEITYANSYLEFPNIGNENNIYIDTNKNQPYRWDNENLKYYKVGSDYNDIKIINGGNASG